MRKALPFTLALSLFLLTACAAQTPAPTVTLPPAPTASQTLPPTATAIPTPTVSPELIALQQQITADYQNLTLKNDGTLEYKGQVYKDTLCGGVVCKIVVDGKEVVLEKGRYHFSDDGGFTADGYTYNEDNGWGVEVVKDYPICTVEKFRDCPTPIEDLFNGKLLAFLRSKSRPFDPSKFKDPMPKMIEWSTSGGSFIAYEGGYNFGAPESAALRMGEYAGYLEGEDGRQAAWFSVEYPNPDDPTNPAKNVWVIGHVNLYSEKTDSNVNSGQANQLMATLQNDMNVPAWRTSSVVTSYGQVDPVVDRTFKAHPDFLPDGTVNPDGMMARIKAFETGDFAAFDGLVLETKVTDHKSLQ